MLRKIGNQVSRSELLDYINIAQNEIFSIDTHFNRTKPDPYLATTDGVYVYELANNVRRVSRVYSLNSNNYNGYNTYLGYKQPQARNYSSSPEVDVPVDSTEALDPDGTSVVKIIFPSQNNPNTTTETFLLEQYEWPTQLTSEIIPLSIPDKYKTTLLYYKVLRLLEEEGYGNSIYNEQKESEYESKWLKFANRSAKSTSSRTLPRDV